ncbi:hypothetical protein K491DRAFT_227281 [Lophiostoma macrostomum CBS 122681]|uniref:Uncharacterized protein n=1 Tax=Lophiostoma macrostomum CBS 122681 TaxID=1314788 RepID=A0A6A6TJH6_9PLEO|nr:hypothetical protein K491DRAFT_227281 [Lophiostoma macrostomum CBS 122681]
MSPISHHHLLTLPLFLPSPSNTPTQPPTPESNATITFAISALAALIHTDLTAVRLWRAAHPHLAPLAAGVTRLGPRPVFLNRDTRAVDVRWQRGYSERWQVSLAVPEGGYGDLVGLGKEEWREGFVGWVVQVLGLVSGRVGGEVGERRFEVEGVVVDVRIQYDRV